MTGETVPVPPTYVARLSHLYHSGDGGPVDVYDIHILDPIRVGATGPALPPSDSGPVR